MEFPTHIVAVSGLIRNSEGKILMMRHPRRGWEVPGGQVETGEDLIAALKREIEEETGIAADIGRLVGVYSNVQTGTQYDGVSLMPTKVIFGFLGQAVSGEPRTSDESLQVGWYGEDEVLNMCTQPITVDRLRDMLEFNGSVVYRSYTSKPYEIRIEIAI